MDRPKGGHKYSHVLGADDDTLMTGLTATHLRPAHSTLLQEEHHHLQQISRKTGSSGNSSPRLSPVRQHGEEGADVGPCLDVRPALGDWQTDLLPSSSRNQQSANYMDMVSTRQGPGRGWTLEVR